MWKAPEPSDLTTVLNDEQLAIAARRAKLDLPPPDDDLIGNQWYGAFIGHIP